MGQETVIVVLHPGCLSYEVGLAAQLLSSRYQILNASPDGKDLPENLGLPLRVQLSYSQIDLTHCKAILIPGGDPDAGPAGIKENLALNKILKEAHAKQIYIGAVGAGALMLLYAGILKGTEMSDTHLIVDQNVFTASPEGAIELAVEIGIRLDVVDARFATRTKDYYRGLLGRKIRALVLGVIKNAKGQTLLHKMHDRQKNIPFYRPLGGGVDFYESAPVALARELQEELGVKVKIGEALKTFENIFTIEGLRGHEMVTLFKAEFVDSELLNKAQFDLMESGKAISQAVWRTPAEIKAEGANLFPVGIEDFL